MGPCNTTIEQKRHMHIRHMIVGLAVVSIGAHGIIIVLTGIAAYFAATCT